MNKYSIKLKGQGGREEVEADFYEEKGSLVNFHASQELTASYPVNDVSVIRKED